jgi:DNA mismatch repair protein MutS2
MNLSDATLQTLEFDKLREGIAIRAASTMGREEILAMRPSSDARVIQTRMQPVVETTHLIAFDDPVSLSRVPDIRPPLQACRIPGAMLSVSELLQIGEVLYGTRRLHGYISKRREKYPSLHDLMVGLTPQENLEESLSQALDPGTETVRDSASSELRRLRRSIEQMRGSLREKVESMAGSLADSVVQDRLVTIRNGRHVIPVKENQKGSVQGIIHDQSASGHTLFIEPMVSVEMGNRLRQLEHAEKQEVDRILKMLTERVAEVHNEIQQNLAILAKFDAIYAKAIYCRELDCKEPVFNDRGHFELRGARHPLLAARLRTEDREKELIPLELTLGTDAYWTLILTGPNAGGKTVALKTVGLLALMAQTGLPIPVRENSELPVLSGVFADIGDKQSIENDLSTFSSHATNLAAICEQADDQSLVLLDEIGSSTDPDQGSALAMSLLGTLTQRRTRTIATTHHGALKAFAHSTEGIENGSMAFDSDTLEPTFHLRLKVPGSSYAFEIARRFGIPADVVDRAVEIAGSEVGRVESLIQNLDETNRAYREQLEKVEAERVEIDEQKQIFRRKLADVEDREQKLKQSSDEEARRILDGANALIEKTVQDIRQNKADKSSIRTAHETVANAKVRLDQTLRSNSKSAVSVSAGDQVFIGRLGKEGTVINDPGHSGRLLVEVGSLRVEVSPSEIEMRHKTETIVQKKPPKVTSNRDTDVSLDIDLRGLTFDEASDVVDRYLDSLSLAGMEQATIIHGKGTGVLRQKIGDFLRTHPLVKTQRLGNSREGGSGVTIVKLDISK